jgi:transposase InsO family protein
VQIHKAYYGLRRCRQFVDYALRWAMVHKDAEKRLSILKFFERHGLAATLEAFGVSRRTLYGWKAKLRGEGGNPASLTPTSTAPTRRRSRSWPKAVVDEIRQIRERHPNLGKEKVHVLLQTFCHERRLPIPSARTIGRLIADASDRMRHAPVHGRRDHRPLDHARRKLRKPKGFKADFPGHLVALDTIERQHDGVRRFLITLIDVHSRFAFALATPRRNSQVAALTLQMAQAVFPLPITQVLTDNGGEFAKHFASALDGQGIEHWHTYPRTPKMNAHVERFNRTVQEEFVDYHRDLLQDDLLGFNDRLFDYLLWYNTQRPHHALALRSPLQTIAVLLNPPQCNMYWPHTLV